MPPKRFAPTAFTLETVDELEALTRERHSAQPTEPASHEEKRQARIDELVSQLKRYPSPIQGINVANSELVRIVGKGNFGVVWQAIAQESRENRAVKIFDFDRLGLGLSLYHFRRGVRAMEHLTRQPHLPPSVIQLFDVDPTGLAYSMPYFEGGDLSNISTRGWRLDKKLEVFEDVCKAVSFAHQHQVLHRDLKPANIVMTKNDESVLTDFDIADLLFIKTLSVMAGGTVSYAAPEQLIGQGRRDATADVFSLGRLLHFLLKEGDPEIVFDSIPKLIDLAQEPVGLVRIIRKCTMRSPEDRYGSVKEILHDLRYHDSDLTVGAGMDESLFGDAVSELYAIMFRSGIGFWFDIWNYHPTAQQILESESIDEVCGNRIEVHLDPKSKGSITHGGPPYRLEEKSYVDLQQKYSMLREAMLAHLDDGGMTVADIQKHSRDPIMREVLPQTSAAILGFNTKSLRSQNLSGNPFVGDPTPMNFLREAMHAVPSVKWAMGIGGLVSIIAIIRGFGIDYRVAGVGTIVILFFMSALVFFARWSEHAASTIRIPLLVFTWFVLLMFIAISVSLFSSVFFKVPVDLQSWLAASSA